MSDMDRNFQPGRKLDKLFTEVIARIDNVAEADITAEYIEEQRKKKIYPTIIFEMQRGLGGLLGGHCEIGLKFYTDEQRMRIRESVDQLMEHI